VHRDWCAILIDHLRTQRVCRQVYTSQQHRGGPPSRLPVRAIRKVTAGTLLSSSKRPRLRRDRFHIGCTLKAAVGPILWEMSAYQTVGSAPMARTRRCVRWTAQPRSYGSQREVIVAGRISPSPRKGRYAIPPGSTHGAGHRLVGGPLLASRRARAEDELRRVRAI
jgi:hypothetical protein